jgi:SMI1-KNR4 cell-wall
MTYVMKEVGRSINDEDIRILENNIGISLPEDYKEFLKRSNGGRPTPKYFPIQGFTNNPVGQVQDFFGIDDPVQSCRLDWKYKMFLGRIPKNLFPIACEDGGSLVCLSLSGQDKGCVYYWDFYGQTNLQNHDNVFLITETFQGFLDSLHFHDPLANM